VRRFEPGLRSETVRRTNLSAIARELHAHGPVSRSRLGARTGLTRGAIAVLIGEFVGAGMVSEQRPGPAGTPGRPSVRVSPLPDGAVALAVDLAVDSLAAAVVGFGGTILAHRRVERLRVETSVAETVAAVAELARSVGGSRLDRHELVGIGAAVAGVVRRTDGVVSMAPNLGWRDVGLGEALATALGTALPVSLANEADLGALAEVRRGAAGGRAHVLFVSGEVGVGGGMIVDGRPLTGVAGYGGEIGHFPLNPRGGRCRCGSIGCLETEVGEDALLLRAGHTVGGGREGIRVVLEEAAAGSPAALAALDHVGSWLGRGLAGMVNVLNPELIVLGGLFGRIHAHIVGPVERALDEMALPAPRGLVSVVPAALADDAPLLGAAELAFEPFLSDPALWFGARQALAARSA
jgi:predicted NBD/HSP70 family sugar kinase